MQSFHPELQPFLPCQLFQVVKFTKSFELLSPKCSADTESRYVWRFSAEILTFHTGNLCNDVVPPPLFGLSVIPSAQRPV